jgi:hypothetical protein
MGKLVPAAGWFFYPHKIVNSKEKRSKKEIVIIIMLLNKWTSAKLKDHGNSSVCLIPASGRPSQYTGIGKAL